MLSFFNLPGFHTLEPSLLSISCSSPSLKVFVMILLPVCSVNVNVSSSTRVNENIGALLFIICIVASLAPVKMYTSTVYVQCKDDSITINASKNIYRIIFRTVRAIFKLFIYIFRLYKAGYLGLGGGAKSAALNTSIKTLSITHIASYT